MEYNVISGDGHIDLKWLPHELFVSNAPAKWKDRPPHVVETREGKKWVAEEKDLASFSGLFDMKLPQRGVSNRIDRMYELGFFEGGPHPTTPDLRIGDQEIDGVDAEVIYPILGMNKCLEDPELLRLLYEIYNTWVADFFNANPDRLVALACIPNDDPEIAAGELRRAASLGLKGADFAVSSASKPIWHRAWDPLWAAADECQMPISFHTTGYTARKPSNAQMAREYDLQYRATRVTMNQISGGEFLASIIFSGALERYPGMKFVLGEAGVSWIPYALGRMDQEYEDQFYHLNFPLKPSEYWHRQGYSTFQNETTVADVAHLVGEDNIVWGSDLTPMAFGPTPSSC